MSGLDFFTVAVDDLDRDRFIRCSDLESIHKWIFDLYDEFEFYFLDGKLRLNTGDSGYVDMFITSRPLPFLIKVCTKKEDREEALIRFFS